VTAARAPKLTANQKPYSHVHAAGSAGLTLEDWNKQAASRIGVKRKRTKTTFAPALLSKGRVRN